MKVKVELDKHETIEQAEDFLEKSLQVKKECGEERYASEFLNEFHDHVCERHGKLIDDVLYQVALEIKSDANRKNPL